MAALAFLPWVVAALVSVSWQSWDVFMPLQHPWHSVPPVLWTSASASLSSCLRASRQPLHGFQFSSCPGPLLTGNRLAQTQPGAPSQLPIIQLSGSKGISMPGLAATRTKKINRKRWRILWIFIHSSWGFRELALLSLGL